MQTWAKRGFQAALVTGGMLVIGAGIANASEATPSVNPLGVPTTDLVAGNVSVPVHIDRNEVGTILGPISTPAVNQSISTRDLTKSLPSHPLATQDKSLTVSAPDNISRGNQIRPEICVPVDISGNAIAMTGNADTRNNSAIGCAEHDPSVTSGYRGTLAGNVLALDYAAPIQITNNAVAVIGVATAHGSSTAVTHTGTNPIVTNGDKGTLTGNVLAGQFGTPVQLTGNGVAVGGNTETRSEASSDVMSGGVIRTSGANGTLAGNAAGLPMSIPVEVNGNGVAWVGNSDTRSASLVTTQNGDNSDLGYIHTGGNPSTLSGNVATTPLATPVLVGNNAVAWIGNTTAAGVTGNALESGGTVNTTGESSTGSGNVIDPELAMPAEVFGSGLTVIGTTGAADLNTVIAHAGGNTYTDGDKSTLGANDVVAPIAGAVDVFGSGTSVLGNSKGVAGNASSVSDGGYNGTLGNGAVGGGNIVGVPVALPAEFFGAGAGVVGSADGAAKETKDITAGDILNTVDDRGTISSNIAAVPVALPVQAFGDAAGVIANVTGVSKSDTTATAATQAHANGDKGSGSGNIAQVPVSLPTQLFGDAANVVGNGDAIAKGTTTSAAGGPVSTSAKGSSLGGNIADVPVAGAVQGLGAAFSAAGVDNAVASNTTSSAASGKDFTDGAFSSVSGNVAQVPVAPVAGVLGDTVTAAGIGHSVADSKVWGTAGNDVSTSGQAGGISGNVARVPVATTADALGDAVTVGGLADALAKSYSNASANGDTTTSGSLGSVSGNVANVPSAVNAGVLSDSVGALGNATNDTTSWAGNFADGSTKTDGHFGAISGDIAQVPTVADAQVLANSASAGGQAFAKNSTQQVNVAGGDTWSSGLAGSLSGDIASVPTAANAEVVHNAVSAAGNAFQAGANKSVDLSGGDLFSNGNAGSVSGDLLQVPVAGIASVVGNPASVAGIAGTGDFNATAVQAAGHQATSGASHQLSGVNGRLPVAAVVQIINVPVELFAQAVTREQHLNAVEAGNEHPALDMPITCGGLMGAHEVPMQRSLPGVPSMPALPGLSGVQVPGLGGVQQRDLPFTGELLPTDNLLPAAHLVQLPKADGIKVMPNVAGLAPQSR